MQTLTYWTSQTPLKGHFSRKFQLATGKMCKTFVFKESHHMCQESQRDQGSIDQMEWGWILLFL